MLQHEENHMAKISIMDPRISLNLTVEHGTSSA